ncbi:MAG: hypothetical protein A2Z91_07800 [Deltaproteobacteria bacterium GWA2_38_16]|nr:MAG: hypothetical protein A2Z91_07800 [Deltaproteobacteria bacterium GWA2_38_16]OGQ03349.1 MAG: hypothetical protein A3D19_04420 [Deltaproteobacteria bacterium RIFCSPHIGHO2_02_FULL_38_15]HBQ20620.1 hypothetical protein [Deltaproteobacteria bacterium]
MLYFEDIFRGLEKAQIDYVVVGGLATVLHGVVRLTADLDLIVALNNENISKFSKTITTLGYKPKAPVPAEQLGNPQKRQEWITEKNMIVFSFYHQTEHDKSIDVFVTEPISFQELNKEKKIIKVDNFKIPICSIKHLIQLKEKAGRPQDLADIKALKKIRLHDEKK